MAATNRQSGARSEWANDTAARPRGLRCTVALAAFLAVCTAIAAVSQSVPALAECGTLNPWPSFAAVAPDSYAVLVGRVERIVSRERHHTGSFVVRVKEVLKGDVEDRITLSDVYTDGGCVVSWLDVEPGDRIAIALGGDSNVNGPVAAVAYLSAIPEGSDMSGAGMQRLTLREVREAADDIPYDGSLAGAVSRSIASAARSFVLLLALLRSSQVANPDGDPSPLPVP